MRKQMMLLVLAMGLGGTFLAVRQLNAAPLAAGTSVVVFLSTEGNLPEPDPGPPTDKLIFTGKKVIDTPLPGCSDSNMPLQNAVLVDPGTTRGGRIISVFVVSADSVPPGTRIGGFGQGVTCTSDGVTYKKFTGIVE